MFEKPPRNKELSRGKARKVARTYAKKEGLRTKAVSALKEAQEAEDRAEYVKRGELRRLVFGTRGRKYDERVYKEAPVDNPAEAPEKGGKRRRAVREYSRIHGVPAQIRKDQERLRTLIDEAKRLETGPLIRLVTGTRSHKHDSSLYEGASTTEDIEEALDRTAEEKMVFRAPKPRRIINITPNVSTERLEKKPLPEDIDEDAEGVEHEVTARVEEEYIPTLTSEEDIEQRVAEAELRGFEREAADERGPVGVVSMTEREMEQAVGRAEFEQFQVEVSAIGKRAGKASLWRRARALFSVIAAGIIAWLGGTQAIDLVEAQSRQPSTTDVDTRPEPLTVRDAEEVYGPYEGPTDAPRRERDFSERDLIREIPEGEREHISPELAEARLERALENPATGVEPVSAPRAQEP